MSLAVLVAADPRMSSLDWYSLAWVGVLAALTFACLSVKSRFARIAEAGPVPAFLAHAVIGYFSLGMVVFGTTAALRARFPVPGGEAWVGGIAVAGGLAALTVGACTLVEHAVLVRSRRAVLREVRLPAA